jgi:hypothetical protein
MHLTFLFFFFGLASWILFILLVPYFLPTIIAILRQKTNTGAIFALNLFLGWSLIGWIISLVWALSSDNMRTQTIIVNNPPPAPPSPAPPHEYKGIQLNRKAAGSGNYTGTKQAEAQQPDKFEQLRKLKLLLDEGVLTQEEFDRQKSRLLG